MPSVDAGGSYYKTARCVCSTINWLFKDYDSRRAGNYALNQLKNLWRSILHKSASNSVLKKTSRTVLQNAHIDTSQRDIYSAVGLNNRLYLDSMLSPSFFLDHFKCTLEIGCYVERAGISLFFGVCIFFEFSFEKDFSHIASKRTQTLVNAISNAP